MVRDRTGPCSATDCRDSEPACSQQSPLRERDPTQPSRSVHMPSFLDAPRLSPRDVARAADELRKHAWPVAERPDPPKLFYLSVRTKYFLVLGGSLAWTVLSIWLSLPWLRELSRVLGAPLALFVIAFIAYFPGFMNAFLVGTILADRRPQRRTAMRYPPVTVLVACYNEGASIH